MMWRTRLPLSSILDRFRSSTRFHRILQHLPFSQIRLQLLPRASLGVQEISKVEISVVQKGELLVSPFEVLQRVGAVRNDAGEIEVLSSESR